MNFLNPFDKDNFGGIVKPVAPWETGQVVQDALFKGKGTPVGAPGEKGSHGSMMAAASLLSPGIAHTTGTFDKFTGDAGKNFVNRWGLGSGAVGRILGVGEESTKEPEYEEFTPKEFSAGDYKTMDTTQLSKDMQRRNAERAAQQQASAIAQMNKMGGLSSGQALSATGNIAAEREGAAQGIEAQLGRMSYEDAMRQWMFMQQQMQDAINQRNRVKQSVYEGKRNREAQDEATLGTLGGMVLGNYF